MQEGIRGLIQVGVNAAGSRKKKILRQYQWLGCRLCRPCGDYILYTNLATWLIWFRYDISKFLSRRKQSNLPRKCGLSPLFSYFWKKFSLLLISFSHSRVGSNPSSAFSDIFSFLPIPRSTTAPKGMASISSLVIQWKWGHGHLLLILKDQAHKSGLEIFSLNLTSKIFTRNELQVKVTSPSSPLQVPPVHQSPWCFH